MNQQIINGFTINVEYPYLLTILTINPTHKPKTIIPAATPAIIGHGEFMVSGLKSMFSRKKLHPYMKRTV